MKKTANHAIAGNGASPKAPSPALPNKPTDGGKPVDGYIIQSDSKASALPKVKPEPMPQQVQ